MPDLEALAAKKGYLKFDVAEHPERIHERFGAAVEHGEATTRADYSGSAVAVEDTRFEGDAHLLGVMSRIGGLLASEYVEGDPIIGDDPKGYGQEPTRVVDDLVARRSVFSAADVANVLSGVVNEPDTFVRLFREAMEHPDLIVLRDDTVADPVRLFTTKAQLGLELDVVDRAARLALLDEQRGPAVGARAVERASATYDLSDEQCAALDVAAHGKINIISGASGSGKSRIAAALGEAHEASGWDVVRVAPTGIGADNLRAASLDTAQVRTVRTVASLEYGIEQGRIELGPRSVLILDEAGQVGAQTADRLLRLVEESGAKLIALRDNDQLGPYEAGPVFQALEARIGGTELGASQRSENALLSGIVERLSAPDMNADEAALDLRSAGVLKAGGTRVDSIEAVAQDYLSDRNPKKVALAHGREDVAALNRAIRAGLDAAVPERALEPSADGAEGALANLRQRDKIVLASSYNADGNWLRAGTAFEVERRSDNEVVLRHGDGHEAQYLKLDVADQDFEYRFGFATTVHGSKGRSIDSVHMLATPGMSKNIFRTGVGLHRQSLNVVLPTGEDNVIGAARAILQTDDTARSVLDYGFDASDHARSVMAEKAPALEREPSKLVDGFNRMVDWVADSVDGGAQGKADQLPSRALRLRGAVVAELIAVRGEAGFSAAERQRVERAVDTMIQRQAWARLLGVAGKDGFDAPFQPRLASKYERGASPQDRMVARTLDRAAQAADLNGERELAKWFKDARGSVQERISAVAREAEIQARAVADRGWLTRVDTQPQFANPVLAKKFQEQMAIARERDAAMKKTVERAQAERKLQDQKVQQDKAAQERQVKLQKEKAIKITRDGPGFEM